jgi:hypothetical protein
LIVTLWQFEAERRLRGKIVAWEDFNRGWRPPIDLAQLESGDRLLRWGAGGPALRYCHQIDAPEARQLLAAAGLRRLTAFSADGRSGGLNRYLVLGAGGAPAPRFSRG